MTGECLGDEVMRPPSEAAAAYISSTGSPAGRPRRCQGHPTATTPRWRRALPEMPPGRSVSRVILGTFKFSPAAFFSTDMMTDYRLTVGFPTESAACPLELA